jgi:geranylgeranyl pyrophosphate synthase
MLGKPAFNDVKEGIITAPLIYALLDLRAQGRKEDFKTLNRMVLSKFENKDKDVPIGIDLLFDSSGIELADQLSIEHIEAGLENLLDLKFPCGEKMVSSEEAFTQGLVGLALKVKTRKY